jgi:hypothetical protein
MTRQLERDFFDRIFVAEAPSETDRAASIRKARESRLQQILGVFRRIRGSDDRLAAA